MRTASPAAAGPSARPSAPRRVAVAAQDKFCRDVVSTPKPASNAVGTATVSFLGAGGAREDVACAKVRERKGGGRGGGRAPVSPPPLCALGGGGGRVSVHARGGGTQGVGAKAGARKGGGGAP